MDSANQSNSSFTSLDIIQELPSKRQNVHPDDIHHHDYVIVFAKDNGVHMQNFHQMKDKIEKAGLSCTNYNSRDDDETFLEITGNHEVLFKRAEKIELKKQLKLEFGEAHHRFVVEHYERYRGSENQEAFLTSYERAVIINDILQSHPSQGGAGIDIGACLQGNEFKACFVRHEHETVDFLMKTWVKKPFEWQPVPDIRDYFGEYVTMYFAWLEHYTSWLSIPSIVGIIITIIVLCTNSTIGDFDSLAVPFYAIFISIWATLYLEFWKRRNSELVYSWAAEDFEEEERIRPAFSGENKPGAYVNGEFVEFKNPLPGYVIPEVPWFSPRTKLWRISVGLSVLATFLVIICVATFGIMSLRLWMAAAKEGTIKSLAPVVGGVCNAVTILVLNKVYRKVAVILTNWENHRTDAEYENSYIIKSFLFQFVNSYISLVYIAFMKSHVSLFGLEVQSCHLNCLSELAQQLFFILTINIFVGQFMEVCLPYVQTKLGIFVEEKKMKNLDKYGKAEFTAAERDSKLGVYESAFDDYNEMVIQYGYLTLFAAALPIAPFLAFVNNLVEIRTDAFKLLKEFQRPHPRSAKNIGRWFQILEIMSYAAIVSNSALVIFTSESLREASWAGKANMTTFVLAIVAIEHFVFLFKLVMSIVIPDVPRAIRLEKAERQYWKELIIEKEANKIMADEAKFASYGTFERKISQNSSGSSNSAASSPSNSLLQDFRRRT